MSLQVRNKNNKPILPPIFELSGFSIISKNRYSIPYKNRKNLYFAREIQPVLFSAVCENSMSNYLLPFPAYL